MLSDVAWFNLDQRGKTLAARVSVTTPNRQAWVSVRPIGKQDFQVLYFEVADADIEHVANSWDYDGKLQCLHSVKVSGKEQLQEILGQWSSNTQLVDPYFCDYPL